MILRTTRGRWTLCFSENLFQFGSRGTPESTSSPDGRDAAGLLRGARRRPQAAHPLVPESAAGGQPIARPAGERSDRPVETVPVRSKMRTTSAPLTADMGGMGFIENNKALCMLSVTINTHLLVAVLERSPRASERAGCQWFCTSPFGTKSQCLNGLPRHYAPSRSTKTWWTSVPICSCTAASTVSKFFSKSASTSSTRPGNVRLSMRPFSPSESDR